MVTRAEPPTRRTVLAACLAAPALQLTGLGLALAQPVELAPTPACDDGDHPTPAQTEGPFFKPDAPLRRDLAADAPNGDRIIVAGFVLDTFCRPIPEAMVQIWHADDTGRYDTAGYRLRGHQFTDRSGRWWFTTIVPALYSGRTRHYHLKARKPSGPILTTQLYFPGEPRNARDRLFDERLLLRIGETADGRFGRFDIVL
ncbi:intradiol ring-cleavage dioxygenase [Inquilinus limosus]|uniref:dioxygenase family protein n=1 Tax=Inquilinus limosus TaxID=171674 RepID=UPI000410711F|nr:intradiol ring-cleavage dioxygenase [Inquilinus limosus]